jgi:predicted 3-demethylubiquinone-9 3-methyltransferase (glyoxalase superfamily)
MFNDKAVEAMDFYTSIFKNSRIVNRIPGPDGKIMGGTIEIDGQQISMYNGGPSFNFSQGFSLMVRADNQEDIDHYYDGLSKGGTPQPCGWLEDKFGVSWQITPEMLMKSLSDPDRAKAGRVFDAMLKMQKIIIADLEAAANS